MAAPLFEDESAGHANMPSTARHLQPLYAAQPAARPTHAPGDFAAVGNFVCSLLATLGLEPGQLVVDVGCGSGWLAPQLACFPRLRYLGTDVSNELLARVRGRTQRDDWLFARTAGDAIPCANDAADFVCLSSLFAHLLPQDAIRYLIEARRALQAGGDIVVPFFDFLLEGETIAVWARAAGLRLSQIVSGYDAPAPLDEIFPWAAHGGFGPCRCLGQSVAVLSKPFPRIA